MFYSDHGEFFDGDIHDSKAGLHKWSQEDSKPKIMQNVVEHRSYAFTCVRNPYTRILSSFFDKSDQEFSAISTFCQRHHKMAQTDGS